MVDALGGNFFDDLSFNVTSCVFEATKNLFSGVIFLFEPSRIFLTL